MKLGAVMKELGNEKHVVYFLSDSFSFILLGICISGWIHLSCEKYYRYNICLCFAILLCFAYGVLL